MRPFIRAGLLGLALAAIVAATVVPAYGVADTSVEVSVGSPDGPFSRNKQNEPAVTVDPNHPFLVAAGSNDNIDMEACNAGDDTTCPFTLDVGGSGIYFSFDSGTTWMQPTYSGTDRDARAPATGSSVPNRLRRVRRATSARCPWYSRTGSSPTATRRSRSARCPDEDGTFSWDNGSRLYYANLTSNLSTPGPLSFKGYEAIAVSRLDVPTDVATDGPDLVDQADWLDSGHRQRSSRRPRSPTRSRSGSTTPRAARTSATPTCASRPSGATARATPLPHAVDGGDVDRRRRHLDQQAGHGRHEQPVQQKKGFGRSGCTIRTDSEGTVYVFANQFAVGLPGDGAHLMIRSFDGGHTWKKPVNIGPATDTCFDVMFDGTGFRCVMDGLAGARDDLSSAPSVDIANGAPSGERRDRRDLPHVGGRWGSDGRRASRPCTCCSASRPMVATRGVRLRARRDARRPRVLLGGGDLARRERGVARLQRLHDRVRRQHDRGAQPRRRRPSRDVGEDGPPDGWTEVHRGADGDPRASAQNNLAIEFLGDYVYASALGGYGVAVWNDVRDGKPCDEVNEWRVDVQDTLSLAGRPAVQQDCDTTFGNTDIFGFTSAP